MSHRALALALALLLLLTQQLGALHRVSHGLALADAQAPMPVLAAVGLPDAGVAADDPGAPDSQTSEASCQICLLLAALTLAALPAWLCWRGLARRDRAPRAVPAARGAAPAGRSYQARAPPR